MNEIIYREKSNIKDKAKAFEFAVQTAFFNLREE